MAANASKVSHRRLVDRFDQDVSEKNLDLLLRQLNEVADRIGFVSYSVEASEDALAEIDDDGSMGKLQADQNFNWSAEQRSDLPSVSYEMIGRLAVFVSEVRCLADRLECEADSMEARFSDLWNWSRLADAITEEAKRDA